MVTGQAENSVIIEIINLKVEWPWSGVGDDVIAIENTEWHRSGDGGW